MTNDRLVFFFGNGKAEGKAAQKELLGGKGANLAEMTNMGIPVPPGFTISTRVCHHYSLATAEGGPDSPDRFPDGLQEQVGEALERLEEAIRRRLGDPGAPLLVSVRSGAAVSMPGMMDTILNLGLNHETTEGLAAETGNPRFAWDSFRRFLQMYGNVVLGIPSERFEKRLKAAMRECGVERDADLEASRLETLAGEYEAIVLEETGRGFPMDPKAQLWGAVEAVLGSWNNERAILYRRLHDIQGLLGTAVNVQAMVFGNQGEDSGTGVCFTRDPSTGERKPYGEFLRNAQGEDVVAGVRTPQPIAELHQAMPEVADRLAKVMRTLEEHYRDMQDIEFTIQKGELFLLQTRNGKRTARAALKIAVDMVDEGLIDEEEALLRIDATQLEQLLHPSFDKEAPKDLLARGIPASPGSAAGIVALDPDTAVRMAAEGKTPILVRNETSPEDLKGMASSAGFLTMRGGKTSHAAVVARQMGKVCVSGCGAMQIDEEDRSVSFDGRRIREGEEISLDGSLGEVYAGRVPTVEAGIPEDLTRVLSWADRRRRLKIRTNADTPKDNRKAREFGAEGIGLCRTEHMFFEEDRILHVRKMILARNDEERREALATLLPMQRGDFLDIFEVMDGFPCNIRLLDPPLHEFLPHDPETRAAVAEEMGVSEEELRQRVADLSESNPMLGHRGCRLGITHPEIYEMQMRAILEAACEAVAGGVHVLPEIMIPLSSAASEVGVLRRRLEAVAAKVFEEKRKRVSYQIGTMIETPRAALTASEIALEAEFFSFGTNDLTQMTFGFSRDDVAGFLPAYLETGILERDPFEGIDLKGVGRLMRIAVEEGRKTRPGLKVGICGESGGDPASILFCHRLELDYVSLSPYRVPTARLAAAQAALREKKPG